MASAWSFTRRASIDSTSRLVSALSLDGELIRCKLSVRFPRAVSKETADSVADDAVSAVAAIIGEEISQGRIPFTPAGLVTHLRSRLSGRDARSASFRVEELDLVPSRVLASRTIQASASPDVGQTERVARSGQSSGMMPAVQAPAAPNKPASYPPAAKPKTLWPIALSECQGGSNSEHIGRLLAPAVRDSAAQLVLRALLAIDPAVTDRLALLAGKTPLESMILAQRHATACVSVGFRRTLANYDLSDDEAVAVAQSACRHALAPERFPEAEFSRYMASDAPLRHMSTHLATALATEADAQGIFAAVSQYTDVLRTDFSMAARDVLRICAR